MQWFQRKQEQFYDSLDFVKLNYMYTCKEFKLSTANHLQKMNGQL